MHGLTALKKGDTVGILSTARQISEKELEATTALLKSWGLRVVLGQSIGAVDNQFAGSDALRAQNFQSFMEDDIIKAIICARGGYGTVRIIDQLDFTLFQKKPKWIVGFSDITVLHSHLHSQCGIPTIHAIMPSVLNAATSEAIVSLHDALFGLPLQHRYSTISPLNKTGMAEGVLVGGNLSLLHTLNNTPSDLDTEGKILFLEDLDEYLYHIDRMMINLKRSGKLAKLKALIVGGFTDMRDNEVPFGKTAEEIISEHVAEYDYPVCFHFPAGHIADNRALILGKNAKLEVQKDFVSLAMQ